MITDCPPAEAADEIERLRARLAEWEQRAGTYMDERDYARARLAEVEAAIRKLYFWTLRREAR